MAGVVIWALQQRDAAQKAESKTQAALTDAAENAAEARRQAGIAKGKEDISLLPKMANRHGLIAGATGTGKTVSLRVLAEQFSRIGVPVFMADVKGDLSGLALSGGENPKVVERVQKLELKDFRFEGYPATFWDVFGEQGHPVRTTISEMGPLLLSRILSLNEVQSGVLSIVFRIADDNGLLLLDLKDLRSMAQFS
jgi:DNA helicase HerA-like ATPase